jgi:hypothetical protein
MAQQINERPEPVVLPDVATAPHPTPHTDAPLPTETGTGDGVLQEALPEITAAARKVGGFKRLAEIAGQLDRSGVGQ